MVLLFKFYYLVGITYVIYVTLGALAQSQEALLAFVCLSVRLCTRVSTASTERLSVKFGTMILYEHLSSESKFG